MQYRVTGELMCGLQVWISLAKFEAAQEESPDHVTRARDVFSEATRELRLAGVDSEQKLLMLQHWLQFEVSYPSNHTLMEMES